MILPLSPNSCELRRLNLARWQILVTANISDCLSLYHSRHVLFSLPLMNHCEALSDLSTIARRRGLSKQAPRADVCRTHSYTHKQVACSHSRIKHSTVTLDQQKHCCSCPHRCFIPSCCLWHCISPFTIKLTVLVLYCLLP